MWRRPRPWMGRLLCCIAIAIEIKRTPFVKFECLNSLLIIRMLMFLRWTEKKNRENRKIVKSSREADLNHRPKDVNMIFQLQSSALPTELSRDGVTGRKIESVSVYNHIPKMIITPRCILFWPLEWCRRSLLFQISRCAKVGHTQTTFGRKFMIQQYFGGRHGACGATDNASDYGSEDSRFESWQARTSFVVVSDWGLAIANHWQCQSWVNTVHKAWTSLKEIV